MQLLYLLIINSKQLSWISSSWLWLQNIHHFILDSADEWKKYGLHFAYHIFDGVQKLEYLETYKKLNLAILTLLGPSVHKSEIRQAEKLLEEFCEEYEVF